MNTNIDTRIPGVGLAVAAEYVEAFALDNQANIAILDQMYSLPDRLHGLWMLMLWATKFGEMHGVPAEGSVLTEMLADPERISLPSAARFRRKQ